MNIQPQEKESGVREIRQSTSFVVPKGYVLTKAESWAWYKAKLVLKTAAVTAVLIMLLYIALVVGVVAATK